jgi:purine-binding chemotaxis protein CheW
MAKRRRSTTFFAEGDESGEMKQLVSFSIGEDEFAVDIKDVKEINKLAPIAHVPRAPKFVEGVISLRGQVVPLINLRERFNLPKIDYDKSTRIIIINIDDKQLGLIVDAVSEVLRISVSSIKAPPEEVVSGDDNFVEGIVEVNGRLVIILDLGKVLSMEEIASIGDIKKVLQEENAKQEAKETEEIQETD